MSFSNMLFKSLSLVAKWKLSLHLKGDMLEPVTALKRKPTLLITQDSLGRQKWVSRICYSSRYHWWRNGNYHSIWKETCWSQLQPLSVNLLSWLPQIYMASKNCMKKMRSLCWFSPCVPVVLSLFLVVQKMFETWITAKNLIHIILQKLRIVLKPRARLFVQA